jgi:hypothetical protein
MTENEWKLERVRTAVFIIAIVLLAYVSPLTIVQAGSGTPPEGDKAPYFPGLPDNAVQYNKTDVTPVAETEQVMAGEPTLFCYRNTTMLMNCTRNCEIVFTAYPEVTPKIFGFSIDPNQTMELTMNLSGSPLEGERVMERTLNFYLGMEPNATLQLSAQIRLHINQTELSQELNREVNASRLSWMYWNRTQGDWEAVESHMDQDGYLVCETDHFSTWTVAEMEPEEAMKFVLDMAFVYAAISVTIVAILAISVVALRRRR